MVPPLTDKVARQRMRAAGLKPLGPYPGDSKVPWPAICLKCGKEVAPQLSSLRQSRGCIDCGNRSSAATRSISASEARRRMKEAGLYPLEPYPGSSKALWRVRCLRCRAETKTNLNRIQTQSGCYTCGQARSVEARRFTQEEAVERLAAFGLTPLEPYKTSMTPWRSRCNACKTIVNPCLAFLGPKNSGCKKCGVERFRQRRLASTIEEDREALIKAGFEPVGEYKGVTKGWRSKCVKCGRISSPRPGLVKARDSGCRHCAGNAPWTAAQAKRHAKRVNKEIIGEFVNTNTPVLMRCLRCGDEHELRPILLADSKGYCAKCSPTARLTQETAVAVMRAADLEPLEPYKNAQTPWRCRCNKCGRIGTPMLTSIRRGQGGCLKCGNYGFDVKKPTILYVLVNKDLGVVKVGITNEQSVRLRDLKRVGFIPGRLFRYDEGSEPLLIETLLIRTLRKTRGLPLGCTRADMRGVGGWTETFKLTDVTTREIYRLIKNLAP